MFYLNFGVGFLEVFDKFFITPASWSLLLMPHVSSHVGDSLNSKVSFASLEGFSGSASLLLSLGIALLFPNYCLFVCFSHVVSDFLLGVSTPLTSFYDDIKTHILKEKREPAYP